MRCCLRQLSPKECFSYLEIEILIIIVALHTYWGRLRKGREIVRVIISKWLSNFNLNLFINEICRVKVLLDKKSHDESVFIQLMIKKTKAKFNKYQGECNLLMLIATSLDSKCNMIVIEFYFPQMYGEKEAREKFAKVEEAFYEVYEEYVCESL